ncbi:MAG TPA: thioesterase family protein, partial [Stellaceae bacterium]
SGVIGKERDMIRIGHELTRVDTREVCALAEHTLAPRDVPYGALAEQRRVLAGAVVPWTTPGFDEIAPPAHEGRMIDSGRDRVKASEVDERGELMLSGFVHRFAGACLHLCSAFGVTPAYMREAKRGFSTFEAQLHLAPPPGAGDGLALRSGLLATGNSSVRMLHELRHARTGERLASFHQAGVHFDLEARRSAPLPAALRERASALMIA